MIGDKLGTRMILRGHPACVNTAKCMQTAAEKGIDIEAKLIDVANGGADDPEYRKISPFGSVPSLQDIDFIVYGPNAIMSYLDDKGFGPSLVPRNGVVRAIMYQWIHIANEVMHAHFTGMGDLDKSALEPMFDALDKQVQSPPKKGNFICGDFTLADIHWAVYCHHCEMRGSGDLVGNRSGVKGWLEKVKSHPSTSKENIVPFTVLPSKQDIDSNILQDIHINV